MPCDLFGVGRRKVPAWQVLHGQIDIVNLATNPGIVTVSGLQMDVETRMPAVPKSAGIRSTLA